MRHFLIYILAFLFVVNANAGNVTQKNHAREIKNIEHFNSHSYQVNNQARKDQHHNKHEFSIDIEEEEDDKLKKLLPFFFASYFCLDSFLVREKVNSIYLSKKITPPVSRYILLEVFRI